ncbi:sirohydrochlorin chelatase [Alicyclobacillus mali (ex Roth et al. 2021)]|uniref:sirohydrochlorin chelatase n=1 Tax=Alicyclobacillus mali (ex Roth et al. 2021) TaxID=1123961 RepID=UPI0023F3F2B3|nr:sirohydrochlorin chelatase [Alicyclobacillus mali (ex Roth et al. 2021)]
MRRTVVFVGHGTRLERGIEEWLGFVRQVAQKAGLGPEQSTCAFVELEPPDVETALVELARAGKRDVLLAPTLLFSAGHMKRDLPQAVEQAVRQAGPLRVEVLPPYGAEDPFVEVAADRACEAVSEWSGGEARGVVLVGRGNRDEAAQRVFEDVVKRIALAVGQSMGDVVVESAYLAGSGRPLEVAMVSLAEQGVRRIAVVPYLWFSGLLTETLPERVARWRRDRAGVEVKVARHLGCDPRLVAAVAERVRTAMGRRLLA